MVHALVELGGSPMLARLLPLFGRETEGEMALQEYQALMSVMSVGKGAVAHYKRESEASVHETHGMSWSQTCLAWPAKAS